MNKFTVENLNLHYGDFHALKNVSLNIPANEITAFIGPSGCGKSTFLNTLNRMNDLVEGCKITGEVRLDDENIYEIIAEVQTVNENCERMNYMAGELETSVAYFHE